MLFPLSVSYRRALLDVELGTLGPSLNGVVLDIGGKFLRRGRFAPRVGQAVRWTRINLDSVERPDIVADAHALPVRNRAADWVFCVEVLQYVRSPETVMAEISRVLGPTGMAVIATPFFHRADSPADRHRFTEVRLRELVEQAGLEVVRLSCQGLFFTAVANLLRQGVARVRPAVLRYTAAALMLPLAAIGRALDRTEKSARSSFLSSVTTGFLVVARRR